VPAGSLRERKKAATRDRLMTVALRLFGERGFEETTVEEIATAADVAPRTFFRYFPTKVDVLFADHQDFVALLQETLATRPDAEPVLTAVRRASLAWIDRVLTDPGLFLVRTRLAATVPAARAHGRYLDAEYEDAIAGAFAAAHGGDPASDLEARMLARTAWAATRAARDVWLATEDDPRKLVNRAFDLLERGFGPRPRRRRPPRARA
jgi:AcrR family transcriptional regulator